ncbi:MAG: NAD(P)-binding domain-containing protein [Myxococcota bacterium]
MTEGRRVAVIGAGPSGLPALKNFAELRFEVTGFDKSVGVGGNWRFDDDAGHSSVFETTHLISSKTLSEYEDFPFAQDVAEYPSHRELLNYFESYAEHFDLPSKIRFRTEVMSLTPANAERWRIQSRHLDTGERSNEVFDVVCVCNGHHHTPRWPDYEGQFDGEYLHSHDYKRAAPFADKRVLVIGGGNSACDVAVETARISKTTVMSWRRGYHLIPKFLFGLPTDVFGHRFGRGPLWLQRRLMQGLITLVQGRNRDIGLPEPDHRMFETHPTMNSDLYLAVRHGRVRVKGDIERLDGKDVIFTDGSRETFDAIIACTGYETRHDFIDPSVFDFRHEKPRLYQKMIPETYPNIYFIGLFQPLGCIWPGAELQAKLAARHAAGFWSPRSPLKTLIDRELAKPDVEQLTSARHNITVHDGSFRKRLRRELARARGVTATRVS